MRVLREWLGHCYYRDIWSVQHCGGVIGMELNYQSSNFLCGNLLSSGLIQVNLFLIVIGWTCTV